MGDRKTRGKDVQRSDEQPYQVHLPGFLNEEAVGLGDAIKRVTYKLGIRSCGGCERRAAALNRRFVFTGRAAR
jgi:hypothetical protein